MTSKVMGGRQPRGYEIDCLLEGPLLASPVMTPIGGELRLSSVAMNEAEEIFEPALEERVSFHVEEEVAYARQRQPGEASARNGVEQLVAVCSISPLRDLEAGLGAGPTEGLGLQTGDPRARRELREYYHRAHACGLKLRRLTACHIRDEAEMVRQFPLGLAAITPAAQTAVTARLSSGRAWKMRNEILKALACHVEVVMKIR
jgi:hypothetical protein